MPWWLNPWSEVRRLRREMDWVRDDAREYRREAMETAYRYVEQRYGMAQRQAEAHRQQLVAMANMMPPKPFVNDFDLNAIGGMREPLL